MSRNRADDAAGAQPRKRQRTNEKGRKSMQAEANDESDFSDADKFSDDEEGGIRIDDIYIPPAPPPVCSYESSGPRLIITHIVNYNFKSYAGRVLVGPFDKSFSSIVGPNGSGKSNVIDSMLFVFGYRATKIRSKKVSVLIHKSENHPNLPSCKVEVHFVEILDKENGSYEKIPGTEFRISRTAFQNSSSFYELNDKRVQFKEVAMTLRKHGIDLIHNRFLILQGEVEQIALMKPKAQHPHETGMLEYLEDIIGTTRYKEPIEKLHSRIELLNEERQEKLNRLKVVESEREALRGPMEETVEFLRTENRIAHLQSKKYQLMKFKVDDQIKAATTEKEIIDKEIERIDNELKEMHEQKAADNEEMTTLNKFVQEKLKKHDEMNEIHKTAEKKCTEVVEEFNQLKKTFKKTKATLKAEEEKLKSLTEVPEKNQAEIEKLKGEEKTLGEQRKVEEAAFHKVMSSLQQETKGFQVEKDQFQAEQIKLQKTYDEMKSAYELAKSERDIYRSTEQAEKDKLEQLNARLSEVSEKLASRKTELNKLQSELPEREHEKTTAENNLNETKTRATAIVGNLRQYKSQLEEKKCSMSANRSQNRVCDYLMQQKREGKIPGIFGRLGDLGAIDAKYDVAVSTASAALDYMLVDTKDTIELCLRALKDDNVGRASFLTLDRMQQQFEHKCGSIPKTPENVPRLFDLIRVQDARVRPAFYYAVRETLVAETLEQASRIAYGATRHRVITLDGALIETSGTMSGGGSQKMRGKMGSRVSVQTDTSFAAEMSELEKTVCHLEEELAQIREQEKSTEEVIARCAPLIVKMKMDVNKLTMEVTNLSKQEPELKRQIVSQTQKVKESTLNPKKLGELETRVATSEQKSMKAETEAKAIEAKVNAIHEKIMQITTGKTGEAQKKLDEVTKKWEKTRSTITQLEVAIKTAERNAKKATERIANMKAELKDAETRTAQIEEENETLERDKKQAADLAATLKAEVDEKQIRLNELQAEHKKYMNEVNKRKATRLEQEQKLEAQIKKIEELSADIPHIDSRMKKLTLHKIPSFRDAEEDADREEPEPAAAQAVGPAGDAGEQTKKKKTDTDPDLTEFVTFTADELKEMSNSELSAQLKEKEEYLKTLTPNLNTLADYEKKTNQFIERTNELKDITERRNLCKQGYEEARKNRLQEFMSGFNIISNKLKELYQMLTMGGDAELDLHDSLDPFTEGINFCVRPPKKSWKNITNLSGGEKTLSSLALVFALHYYRPTPLYVMDEIDAALDFKNVSIVGYYIKERTKNAQFIVISLRTNMFELATMLTGIYKTYNCTKSITVNPDRFGSKRDSGGKPVQPPPNRPHGKNRNGASSATAVRDKAVSSKAPASTSNAQSETPASPILRGPATTTKEPPTSGSQLSQAPMTAAVRETASSPSRDSSSSGTEAVESDKENDGSRINNSDHDVDATLTERRKLNSPVTSHVPATYSSVDEDSDQSDILRRAAELGL